MDQLSTKSQLVFYILFSLFIHSFASPSFFDLNPGNEIGFPPQESAQADDSLDINGPGPKSFHVDKHLSKGTTPPPITCPPCPPCTPPPTYYTTTPAYYSTPPTYYSTPPTYYSTPPPYYPTTVPPTYGNPPPPPPRYGNPPPPHYHPAPPYRGGQYPRSADKNETLDGRTPQADAEEDIKDWTFRSAPENDTKQGVNHNSVNKTSFVNATRNATQADAEEDIKDWTFRSAPENDTKQGTNHNSINKTSFVNATRNETAGFRKISPKFKIF